MKEYYIIFGAHPPESTFQDLFSFEENIIGGVPDTCLKKFRLCSLGRVIGFLDA